MSLSEQTTINLKIGTLLTLGGLFVSAVVYFVTMKTDYQHNVDRLDNVRNRVWVIEHPNHPWSKRYIEEHRDDQ